MEVDNRMLCLLMIVCQQFIKPTVSEKMCVCLKIMFTLRVSNNNGYHYKESMMYKGCRLFVD